MTGSARPQKGHWRSPYSTSVTGASSGPRVWSRSGSTGTARSVSSSDVPSSARIFSGGGRLAVALKTSQVSDEAAEAAAAQGRFWEMHDLLLAHQDALRPSDLAGYAAELGLDVERFTDELRRHEWAGRVAEDVDSADLSTVSGTPTFFVNGVRHQGAYDIQTLADAVRAARARASIAA